MEKKQFREYTLRNRRYCKNCGKATKHKVVGRTVEMRRVYVKITECKECGHRDTEPMY